MTKRHNIFISHYERDDKQVQSLKQRLKDSGKDIRNFSVDSTKHKDGRRPSKAVIQRLLSIRIKACNTFICLIGSDTHTRPWVDFEIKKAHAEGKTIIGIYKYGDKNKVDIPERLVKYGSSIIGWNSLDKLVDIIEGNTSVFENPDGSPSTGYHKLQRVSC